MADSLPRHTGILSAADAVAYLHLDAATDSPEAALRVLARLAGQKRIHPIAWAKTHLYSRDDLDRFVAREVAGLSDSAGCANEDAMDR